MISQTAEYALRAAVALAQAGSATVLTPQLARTTRVPQAYLAKVLQTLARAGLVRSQRGLRGGFALTRPAAEITLLEVVSAVDPVKRIERCPLGLDGHGTNLCPLHRRLDQATAEVERSLADVTIADILDEPGRSTPLCQPGDRPALTPLETPMPPPPEDTAATGNPPAGRRDTPLPGSL
ncbi:MAG: Rrf2 family transcriptional regulator [Planctomycetes bacterium]|nr:Rrf2 family transcriptional regulator [Planctomycetota bacterium]